MLFHQVVGKALFIERDNRTDPFAAKIGQSLGQCVAVAGMAHSGQLAFDQKPKVSEHVSIIWFKVPTSVALRS
jgi:hypothetical protein